LAQALLFCPRGMKRRLDGTDWPLQSLQSRGHAPKFSAPASREYRQRVAGLMPSPGLPPAPSKGAKPTSKLVHPPLRSAAQLAATARGKQGGAQSKADKTRFVGRIKSKVGVNKHFIKCHEVTALYPDCDAKITWKSNAPPGLEVGKWVEFSVIQEYPDDDWGSPLAVEIVHVDPPQSAGDPQDTSQEVFQRVFLEPPDSPNAADRRAMQAMRLELGIVVEGDAGCEFPPLVVFDELQGVLPDYALQALGDMGVAAPTPIQAQALPLILSGKDLVGIAPEGSGSGEVLAFLLPAIAHIEAHAPIGIGSSPIALVLVATSDLARLLADTAERLLRGSQQGVHADGIGVTCVWDAGISQKGWKGSHVVIAKPDRLLDLVDSGDMSLEHVTCFVVNEADRMLASSQGDNVENVGAKVRPDRHTVIFTSQYPPRVQELTRRMCPTKPLKCLVGRPVHGR